MTEKNENNLNDNIIQKCYIHDINEDIRDKNYLKNINNKIIVNNDDSNKNNILNDNDTVKNEKEQILESKNKCDQTRFKKQHKIRKEIIPKISKIHSIIKNSNGNEEEIPLSSEFNYKCGYYLERKNISKDEDLQLNKNLKDAILVKPIKSMDYNTKKNRDDNNINKNQQKRLSDNDKDFLNKSEDNINKKKDYMFKKNTNETIKEDENENEIKENKGKSKYNSKRKTISLNHFNMNDDPNVKRELVKIIDDNRKYQDMPELLNLFQEKQKEQETIITNNEKLKPILPQVSFCTPSMNISKYPDYLNSVADPPHAFKRSFHYQLKIKEGSNYVSKLYKSFNKKKKCNSVYENPVIDLNATFARRKKETKK